MIKISHESPLCLLEESREYNDYDYALVHLFEEIPEYYNFFIESLRLGREVLLDNSIFELGESFDIDKFAQWILKLKPTKYIIPDALDDSQRTIDNLDRWIERYNDISGKKIGVVQGRNYDEIVRCYKYLDQYCDEIAVSFNYLYYIDLVDSESKIISWFIGRQKLLTTMLDDGIININKPHHLLGCSLPQEFYYYLDDRWDFIKSLDTSNPIIHGIKRIRYKSYGLNNKENIKLVDLIYSDLDDDQLECIYFNIKKFRQIINGK